MLAVLTVLADNLAAPTLAEVIKDEPSKLPFYILGGAAAAWAVVLFALGMRSADFPASPAAQRGVMALSVLVVAGAMATAVITA